MDLGLKDVYTHAARGTLPAGTPPPQTEDVTKAVTQGTFTYQM